MCKQIPASVGLIWISHRDGHEAAPIAAQMPRVVGEHPWVRQCRRMMARHSAWRAVRGRGAGVGMVIVEGKYKTAFKKFFELAIAALAFDLTARSNGVFLPFMEMMPCGFQSVLWLWACCFRRSPVGVSHLPV
jgi:hypothetical protein